MILGVPTAASGATLYVDDSATTPNPFCINPTPANACLTINDAITQSRGLTGPDTIMVAAGNYPEDLDLNDDADAGLTLDGAGTNTTGSGTVLQVPTSANLTVLESNVTIRDIAIEASNVETLYMGSFVLASPSTGQRLENVIVELNDQVNTSRAIRLVASNDAVLDHVQVSGDAMWDGSDANALHVANSTNVLLTESRLLSNSDTLYARASTLAVSRSLVAGPFDLADYAVWIESDLAAGLASLTMVDSLVALGSRGINVEASFTDSTATATIRNSTIDPGMPKGTADLVGVGVLRTGPATVDIENSIVVGSLTSAGAGAGSTTCTYSDVQDTVSASIACPATAGNPANNSSSTPGALFVPGGFLGLDWHLLGTSPAIDTGAPGAIGPGEPTVDFDGNSRLLDGNFDCVARRDKGAYEMTDQSAPCPSSPATGNPASGSKKSKRCKKKKQGKRATGAKKKRCKKQRR